MARDGLPGRVAIGTGSVTTTSGTTTVRVIVRAGEGGSGAYMGESNTVSVPAVPVKSIVCSLLSPFAGQAGQKYTLEIRTTGNVEVAGSNLNSYTSGAAYWSGTNMDPTFDFAFKTYLVETSPAFRVNDSGTVQVGQGGSALNRIGRATISYTPPNLGASSGTTALFAVSGVRVGTNVIVNARGDLGDLSIQWVRVLTDDQIQVRFYNTANLATNRPVMGFDVTYTQ